MHANHTEKVSCGQSFRPSLACVRIQIISIKIIFFFLKKPTTILEKDFGIGLSSAKQTHYV